MQSLPFIAWCLEHLNYWVITLLMAIESSFIPFPSEIVVPPAAYLSASETSNLNVFLVVVFATIGAIIGALINYLLAKHLGRPLVYKFATSRVGHMLLLDGHKVQTAEQYFAEHGALGTFIGRLVPAVRQLISIPAGLARMNIGKFIAYTALGAGVWNTILAAIGYYLANVVPYEQLDEKVAEYATYLKIAMIVLGGAFILYLIYRGLKKKPSNPNIG